MLALFALLSSITVCTILGAVICFWLAIPSAEVIETLPLPRDAPAYVAIGAGIWGAIIGFSIGVSVGIALIWKIAR